MTINETKSIIQEAAIESLKRNNGGIVAAVTGIGKAKIGIDYITAAKEKLNRMPTVLLVVPTEKLRDINWKTEFDKWGTADMYNSIDRTCYVSMNKIRDKHYDIVIMDECHNITINNSSFFDFNRVNSIVGLTATMPKELDKLELLGKINLRVTYTLTVKDAIARGVMSPYRIEVFVSPLDEKSKNVLAGSKKTSWLTTEKRHYDYLSESVDNSHGENRKFAILRRMRFIFNLSSKLQVTKFILKNISENKRVLIFGSDIKNAELLCKNKYHSKTKDADLKKFMDSTINRLATVKALNEGMNIPNLDCVVIQQLSSKNRHLIQRIGRIRYRENHIGVVYISVAKGTQDEVWLASAIAGMEGVTIRYHNVKLTYKK